MCLLYVVLGALTFLVNNEINPVLNENECVFPRQQQRISDEAEESAPFPGGHYSGHPQHHHGPCPRRHTADAEQSRGVRRQRHQGGSTVERRAVVQGECRMKKLFHRGAAAFTEGTELKNILLYCRKRFTKGKWLLCRIMKTVILMLKWEIMNLQVNVLSVLFNLSL